VFVFVDKVKDEVSVKEMALHSSGRREKKKNQFWKKGCCYWILILTLTLLLTLTSIGKVVKHST